MPRKDSDISRKDSDTRRMGAAFRVGVGFVVAVAAVRAFCISQRLEVSDRLHRMPRRREDRRRSGNRLGAESLVSVSVLLWWLLVLPRDFCISRISNVADRVDLMP